MADKPCVVAIDEFQQIGDYEEKNVEALLRTKIQSALGMSLEPLPLDVYANFCQSLFEKNGKHLNLDVVEQVYNEYEGYTWYMHMMMNELYADTEAGQTCKTDMLPEALQNIVVSYYVYDYFFAIWLNKVEL